MTLEAIINDEIKKAMLAKDSRKLAALRAIKSEILLLKTGKGNDGITPEMELAMLQKMIKQRKESADIYKSQNRQDLYDEEVFQASVIDKFMPEQMSPDKIRDIVKNIIDNVDAKSIKDMGKVIGIASKQLAGKADNKIISDMVKELLIKSND